MHRTLIIRRVPVLPYISLWPHLCALGVERQKKMIKKFDDIHTDKMQWNVVGLEVAPSGHTRVAQRSLCVPAER